MPTRNIKLLVEYKGTTFSGWQVQPGQRTIQGEITAAIRKVTACDVDVIGAGRTDAGVHALGQVANFHIDHPLASERYKDALNFHLPDDIRIHSSVEVSADFNSRFSARWRRYRYVMSQQRSAIYRDLRWENPVEIDYEVLQAAARTVVGEHDFGPFCVTASQKPDNTCVIAFSRWYRLGPLMVYEICGNRFLHSMVRSLVGAMVNLAGKPQDNNVQNLTLERFRNIILGQIDERVVFTAPAQGLYLVAVGYNDRESQT
ncbi:MAG: tRNA pseudouridine(38-40) synthase TruA [Candidatus Zixiibacteriota bacterium]